MPGISKCPGVSGRKGDADSQERKRLDAAKAANDVARMRCDAKRHGVMFAYDIALGCLSM